MAKETFKPFLGHGYNVWADNAFTSVALLKWCKEHQLNFAGTTRTTFGFPEKLIDQDLPPGGWSWMMAEPGILAAFWSDVGFVKLMSNFHSPVEGQVLRRVKGEADRVERSAPTVAVGYNNLMGGTDLKDFMRGQFTTQRRSKKWWHTLMYWVLDSSMYNSFCLYKFCYKKVHEREFKGDYKKYIRQVVSGYIGPVISSVPSPATPVGVSAAGRRIETCKRRRVTRTLTPSPAEPAPTPTTGPNGETGTLRNPPRCPLADLEPIPGKFKNGKNRTQSCAYCAHSNVARKKRKDTRWRCGACKVPLCVSHNVVWHRWVDQHYS